MYYVAKIIETTKKRNQFNIIEWLRIRLCNFFSVQQEIPSVME